MDVKNLIDILNQFILGLTSIAASQGIQYQSDYFEIFKNNIILGSLGGLSLFRMIFHDEKIINIERINVNERVRDILEIQDGRIAIYTDGGSVILFQKIN